MHFGTHPSNPLDWFALKAGKVPLPILDVIIGPLQARALQVAQESGVLDALSAKPIAGKALAAQLSLDGECLELVLRVLRAMTYVDLSAAGWTLSKIGQRYFGPGATEPYRDFVAYGAPQWAMLDGLGETLRSGRGKDFHAKQTAQEWVLYQRAMLENAHGFAWFVAEHLPVKAGARQCLDLAGAHGLVGAELCRKHSGLRSTVFDLPEALKTARPLAQGHADLVSFREGNLLEDDYGGGFDAAILCNILHHFAPQTNVAILRKVHAALGPGGSVGIFDIETPEPDAAAESAGDAFALYFRVTSTSACFRGRDYEGWLASAGFRNPRTVRSVKMPSRMLVVAEK